MSFIEYLLFSILLMLLLGGVIAFSQLVIRPLRVHWAITEGRKMVASRNIGRSWRYRNVCRTLATARNDLEAAKLWKRLDELKDLSGLTIDK